jgi:hypothetical protein
VTKEFRYLAETGNFLFGIWPDKGSRKQQQTNYLKENTTC